MALLERCALLIVYFTWPISAQFLESLNIENGHTLELKCDLNDTNVTLPEWKRLSSMVIFYQNSSTVNQNLPIDLRKRISRHINQRDLFISAVRVSDAGGYLCSYTGKGNLTIQLSVSDSSGDSFPWWGIFLSVVFVVVLYMIGILIGVVRYCIVTEHSVFKIKHMVKTGNVHDTVRFELKLTQDVDVIWEHNNSEITDPWKHVVETDGLDRILKIRNIYKEDSGIYIITAANERAEAELIVAEDSPTNSETPV